MSKMINPMQADVALDRSRVTDHGKGKVEVNAQDLTYRELNLLLRVVCDEGAKHLLLKNVNGQRYIATDLPPVKIDIEGCAGNDLGVFMNGCEITVNSNCQDAVGNTMNAGSIIVHGHSSDIAGFAMRGGKVYIRDNSGYRCGIHMKEYEDKIPVLVVGGVAHDFLGEYMAGGVLLLLNRPSVQGATEFGEMPSDLIPSHHIGTGMHGGVIYLRGRVEPYQLGAEVAPVDFTDKDTETLHHEIDEYCNHFEVSDDERQELKDSEYVKLIPVSHRPYGKMYAS